VRIGDGVFKLLGLCLLAGVLVAGLLFPVVGAVGVASNRASDTIESISADLVTAEPPLVTTITDSAGNPIARLFDQYRVPTAPDQISPAMKAALVSIEDKRFYEHEGMDWKRTIQAAISNQTGSDVQGASTLTQQYVKNYLINVVYRDNKAEQAKAQEQTIARKLREARVALQLEQKMTKDEILTGYLNVVEFAQRVYGVGAAAHAYFHTTPDQLTVAQGALLAGMVNNPVLYDPWRFPERAKDRRNLVIDTMVSGGLLTKEAGDAAKSEPLGILPSADKPAANCVGAGPEYGFYCQYVYDYLRRHGFTEDQLLTGGFTIKTSFDANATKIAKQMAENEVPKETKGIANTMAIIRPGKTKHQVVALVANRDYGLDANQGQTTYGLPTEIANKFGAGSIFKTFTAAAAMERGVGTNTPIPTPSFYVSSVFNGGGKSCPSAGRGLVRYCVQNSSPNYPAQMTLAEALKTSPNTGFVYLEEKVGMEGVVDMASRLGLRDTMASNMMGNAPDPSKKKLELNSSQATFFKPRAKPYSPGQASFTLGPAPVSTLELANVAATLMSGGVWCPPTPLVEVLDRNGKPIPVNETPCEQAVAEPLANTMVNGMSQDDKPGGTAARAAASFNWTRPILGKTGTTQDHKSAGFIGATPQLAGAVLTFNDSPTPRPICDSDPPSLCGDGNIYGGKVPARTWFAAMSQILANAPVAPLPAPDPRYVNGFSQVPVPNVVGKSVNDATNALTQAGYKVVTKEQNSSETKGTVIGQTPRGTLFQGDTITLYVSTGYIPVPQNVAPQPGG
jgi:membrane peptidoglycan carboxypeptidase